MSTNDLQFRLTITCENAAFEDSPEVEIARILSATARRLLEGTNFDACRNLLDASGNIVGTAALKTVEEHDGGRVHDRKARIGQDYMDSLDDAGRAQLDKALAWQRAGKGRVIAYLEAGRSIPAAALERFHVVNAGGSRGQYVYLEPRS